jgi:hypothetical protein
LILASLLPELLGLRKVGVDFYPVRQVEGDRAVDLLRRQARKVVHDGFRAGAVEKLVNNGFEGHPGSGDVIAAIAPFNVFCNHRSSWAIIT